MLRRAFEIDEVGLNTQPLPTPYAQWDVTVVQGKELLAARGVVGVKIIASFNAVRNEDMLCRGERRIYSTSSLIVSSPAGSVQAESTSSAIVSAGALGGLGAVLAGGLIAYSLRSVRSNEDDPETEGLVSKKEGEAV